MPSPSQTPSSDMHGAAAVAYRAQPSRSLGQRIATWALWLVALIAGLVLALALALTLIDWNRVKPWVNDKVSEATGRRFAIEGDLSAAWHWPQPLEDGW